MTLPDEDMPFGEDPPVEPAKRRPPAPPITPAEVIGQGADEEAAALPDHRAAPIVARQRDARNTPAASRAPIDRAPPYSAEAEEHVIACCLLDGSDTIARAIEAGLTPESFYLPENRLLYQVMREVHATGQALSLELLAEELTTRKQMALVGGYPYLMQVTGKIPTTAHAGYFIEKVREKAVLREIIRQSSGAIEEAYNFTGGLDELLQMHLARVESLATGAVIDRKADTLKALLSRRVTAANPPKEPVTRLFLADKPIATPGNLQTITAKSKTGKTVATGGATAAVIVATTGTTTLHDTFKFRASNPQGHAVIIIDTEQSPYDAWTCYQRILARAGEDKDPPWLLHFALVGYSVQKRKAALASALEYAKKTFGGVFLVILDGVAHFVSSVNEIEECNTLADWLRELSVTYDTALLLVIHANEGEKSGDDSRGHLGKQLMRDAESNLLLKKDGEITTITSEKQRKAPITEQDGIAFRWSDDQQMHVSCEKDAPAKRAGGRTRLHTIHEFMEVIPVKGAPAKSGSVLHRAANDLKEIKLQTFKDLLADATKDGTLLRFFDEKTGFTYTRAI